MEFFLDTFEGKMPDAYYINHSQLPKLLYRAKQIVNIMEVNNKKYNFQTDIEQWDREEDEDLNHGAYPTDEDKANFIAKFK